MAFTREFFSHPIARLNVICWGDFQSIFIFFQLTLWLIAETFVRKNKPFVCEKTWQTYKSVPLNGVIWIKKKKQKMKRDWEKMRHLCSSYEYVLWSYFISYEQHVFKLVFVANIKNMTTVWIGWKKHQQVDWKYTAAKTCGNYVKWPRQQFKDRKWAYWYGGDALVESFKLE